TARAYGAAHGKSPAIRDVVVALKDRLITEPGLDSDEESQIADFFGVSSLDAPLDENAKWPDLARLYCGVLIKSPQFMLRGVSVGSPATAPAPLLPGAGTYREHCERLARLVGPEIRGAAKKNITCGDGSLTIE